MTTFTYLVSAVVKFVLVVAVTGIFIVAALIAWCVVRLSSTYRRGARR